MKQLHYHQIHKKNNFIKIIGTLAVLCISLFALLSIEQVNSTLFPKKEVVFDENGIEIEVPDTVTALLVGRGGGYHDAPDLTDTIILAKLNKETKEVALLSLPRDLYVTYPDYGMGKINSVYASYLYRSQSKTNAMEKLVEKIEEISGEQIDYYVNVDFNGFTQIIDTLGGIEVNVPERLVDSKYPTKNWGYQTIVFDKGLQTMNGDDALKYARSRKSTSDYDRSLRQQLVIEAVKNKIGSSEFITSPKKISELYDVFNANVFTNVTVNDALRLALGIDIFTSEFQFYSSNVNDSCFSGSIICEKGGFVYNPSRDIFGGQSVALFDGTTPSTLSNYDIAKQYAHIALNYPKVAEHEVKLVNATNYPGQALAIQYKIKRYGFSFNETNYATSSEAPLQTSTIYYHGIPDDAETLSALKTLFKGELQKVDTAQFPLEGNTAPIEIVLGNDSVGKNSVFTF